MALNLPHPSTQQMPPSTVSTDESDSRLLKSRTPRKTLILEEYSSFLSNLQCPLQKGIIYYNQRNTVFEHVLFSSSNKHRREIVANLQPALMADSLRFELVPIKHNRIFLMGRYITGDYYGQRYLYISIHEVHSSHVGPALWIYHDSGHSNILQLRLIKSTKNTLGITFGVNYESHMDLFDVSTEGDYPLIEAGRLNYNQQLNGTVELSPDRSVLLNAGSRRDEMISILYSGSGDTSHSNNIDFSFVTNMPIPNPNDTDSHEEARLHGVALLAFSNDGSKFATGMADGVVSVWDVRSTIPLKVFVMEVPTRIDRWHISFLQFSSGILGRESLVFMENEISTALKLIHIIDATSFETEEIISLPIYNKSNRTSTLFFDPSGGSMYAELDGMLYEWDMQENGGPEWWLGEE